MESLPVAVTSKDKHMDIETYQKLVRQVSRFLPPYIYSHIVRTRTSGSALSRELYGGRNMGFYLVVFQKSKWIEYMFVVASDATWILKGYYYVARKERLTVVVERNGLHRWID